jgi:hypothetical protein
MRTSTPRWATMQRVPAGVAQSAEQPSCKRQVSGSNPLTGSMILGHLRALSPADSCRRRGNVMAAPRLPGRSHMGH